MEHVVSKAEFNLTKMIIVIKSVEDVPWYEAGEPVFADPNELYESPTDSTKFIKLRELAELYPVWAKYVCGMIASDPKTHKITHLHGGPTMCISFYYYKDMYGNWVFHTDVAKNDFLEKNACPEEKPKPNPKKKESTK